MFPDSAIANKYSCRRTKSAAIIQSMAKTTATIIADNMINGPFLLATDCTSKALSYAYGREEEGTVLLSTSLGETFFAWRFILNENILF